MNKMGKMYEPKKNQKRAIVSQIKFNHIYFSFYLFIRCQTLLLFSGCQGMVRIFVFYILIVFLKTI